MTSGQKRAPRSRIRGLDLARAIALFGIMGNHLLGAKTTVSLSMVVTMSDYHAAAFAVLIGCGVQLELEAAHRRQRSALTAVLMRAVFLIVVGLALGWVIHNVAVILVTLGLLTLVAHFAARLPQRTLVAVGIVVFLGGPALTVLNREHGWVGGLLNPNPTHLMDPFNTITALLIADPYPFLAWFLYALVGIGYVRWGRTHVRRPLWSACCCWVSAFVVAQIGMLLARTGGLTQVLTDPEGYSGSYLNVVTSALVVMGLILLCARIAGDHLELRKGLSSSVAAAEGNVFEVVVGVLVSVGQMTLTWYVVHVLVSERMIPFLENLPRRWAYLDFGVWALQVGVIVALTAWHRQYFQLGPLEAVPRWLAAKTLRR